MSCKIVYNAHTDTVPVIALKIRLNETERTLAQVEFIQETGRRDRLRKIYERDVNELQNAIKLLQNSRLA